MGLQIEDSLHKEFPEDGLYIRLENNDLISINVETILDAEDKIEEIVRGHGSCPESEFFFQRCGGCPSQDEHLCDGIRPIYLTLKSVSNHPSYEPVTAIYHKGGEYVVKETTLQHALEYVVHMLITEHCYLSKTYSRYYEGVRPLMNAREIAEKVFVNILAEANQDIDLCRVRARQLEAIIDLTARSRSKRIGRLTNGDALLNANANMALPTQFLEIFLNQDSSLEEHEKSDGWKDTYSLGISELDRQHKQLVNTVSDAIEECEERSDKRFSRDLLLVLLEHTSNHFEYEERLIKEKFDSQIPDEHLHSHKLLIERLEGLIHSGEKEFHVEILDIIRLWILEHILVYDSSLLSEYNTCSVS